MSRTVTPAKKRQMKSQSAAPAPGAKPEQPEPTRVSPWVKLFVAFHILAITIWAIPNPPEGYLNGRIPWKVQTDSIPHLAQSLNDGFRLFNATKLKPSFVKYYDMPTGLWQYWDMFAPNPANIDYYGDAEVTYQDGTKRIWTYPRMYTSGIFQKYFTERFRKYYERANSDGYSYVWAAFAQRVALLSTADPKNPAVEVRLRRHWLEIVPPGKPQPTEYNSHEYFTYPVDEVKLQHDLQGEE